MPKVTASILLHMGSGPDWMEWGLVGLFLASFLAATILPFSSEAVLLTMVASGMDVAALFFTATAGNTLGGGVNYTIGRWLPTGRLSRWARIDMDKACRWAYLAERHGAWAALLCWLPVIGDPLALALGLFRARVLPTMVLMALGKAARYAVLLWVYRSVAGA